MKSKIKYPILGYAPGHYSNNCMYCDDIFMGDKYARMCEPCAVNHLNVRVDQLNKELNKCIAILEKLKSVKEELNKLDIER